MATMIDDRLKRSFQTQCLAKVAFMTTSEAYTALKRSIDKHIFDHSARVYKCPHCHAYHIGKNIKNMRRLMRE